MTQKAHLLIVDDEANTLASLSRAFRLEGHEATELSEIIAKISDWIDVPPAADAADNPSHDTATTVPNSLACVVMASPQRDPRSS